jgi:hypothetical protein
MSMRSSTSPRRVYTRAGSVVVCYGGIYFGPLSNKESKINPEKEVRIEVLDKSGGKSRIKVTQKVGSHPAVTETWNEKHLTFEKRASA